MKDYPTTEPKIPLTGEPKNDDPLIRQGREFKPLGISGFETVENAGNNSDLTTEDKSTKVGAINEVNAGVGMLNGEVSQLTEGLEELGDKVEQIASLGIFVREYNGEVGIGVDVIPAGGPPAVTGNDGDFYFTLAFNETPVEGMPGGWILIVWEWEAGMWEFSSTLLPVAAEDLHWVAVKDGEDIAGHYIILAGDTAADLPKWELLGAAAVVPDGVTIDYDGAGRLKTIPDPLMYNPNLLDNSDFAVNQRGLTSYELAVSDWAYTIDRWGHALTAGSGTLSKVTGGIRLARVSGTGSFFFIQRLESKASLPPVLTLSTSVDGIVYSHTATADFSTQGIRFNPKTKSFSLYPAAIEIVRFDFSDYAAGEVSPVINWVKLEAGSTATQYVKPNPATEMYKCQRYLAPISTGSEIVVKDSATILIRPFHLRPISSYGVYNPDGLTFYLKSLDGATVSPGVVPTSFTPITGSGREGMVRIYINPHFPNGFMGVQNMNVTSGANDNFDAVVRQPVLVVAEI